MTQSKMRLQLQNQIHSATIELYSAGEYILTEAAGLTVDHPNLVTRTQCLIWGGMTNQERCFIDNISAFMFRTDVILDQNSKLSAKLQELGYSPVDAERYLAHRWDLDRFFKNFIPLYGDSLVCHRLAALFFLTNGSMDRIDWVENDYKINRGGNWYTLPSIPKL